MSVWVWLGVAGLGALAAAARLLLHTLIYARAGSLQLGTFAVNVSGSLLLGLTAGLALSGSLLVLAGAATLGSYTTFSTWMLETQRLAEEERHHAALLNVAASVILGVAAVALGRAIGSRL
jgi:fluoride exporter